MTLFRKRTLHTLIEDTTSWQPRVNDTKRRRANNRRQGDDGSEIVSKQASNYQIAGGLRKQGTINLIRNLMKHRVNIVKQEIEYDEISESESLGDGQGEDGNHLRRMLQQKMQKEVQSRLRAAGRSGLEDSDEEVDIDRGSEGEDEDMMNYRTGGPIQLESELKAQKTRK